MKFDLGKGSFQGVWDLIAVPSTSRSGLEETPGYLEGRLCMHEGHGTSQLAAMNVLGPRAKTRKWPKRGLWCLRSAVAIPSQLYACF